MTLDDPRMTSNDPGSTSKISTMNGDDIHEVHTKLLNWNMTPDDPKMTSNDPGSISKIFSLNDDYTN